MSAESHIDAFLDLFHTFEEQIILNNESRKIGYKIAYREDRIALFGVYMATRRDE